jgi:hypothetical protein
VQGPDRNHPAEVMNGQPLRPIVRGMRHSPRRLQDHTTTVIMEGMTPDPESETVNSLSRLLEG